MTPTAISELLSHILQRAGRPMLDRELRGASRRRRTYVLRFAYVGLLTFFVALVWLLSMRFAYGSALFRLSRMAATGKYVILTIVWFQFIAAQLGIVVLLGDVIAGEVRRRSLPVLMVTPMSDLQIVVGKFVGALVYIVPLLAISLPLLGIVRLLGGVPWDYLLSGVCITLSAVVFVGTLSLLSSAISQSGLGAAWGVIWSYAMVFGGMDTIAAWLSRVSLTIGAVAKSFTLMVNPFDMLIAQTRGMLAGQPSAGLSGWWPLHCLILLGFSVPVLYWTAQAMRDAAFGHVAAHPEELTARERTPDAAPRGRTARWLSRRRTGGEIRRVTGPPIVWRELHRGLPPGWSVETASRVFAAGMCVIVIGNGVVYGEVEEVLAGAHGIYLFLILLLAVSAGGSIAREREARTLPVLLATPLADWEIVMQKATAFFRSGLPFLLAVLLLYGLVCLHGVNDWDGRPVSSSWMGLRLVSLSGIMPLLIGLGIFYSVRLRTTAAAVTCTLAVAPAFTFFVARAFGPLFGDPSTTARHMRDAGAQAWMAPLVLTVFPIAMSVGFGLILLRAASRQLRRSFMDRAVPRSSM